MVGSTAAQGLAETGRLIPLRANQSLGPCSQPNSASGSLLNSVVLLPVRTLRCGPTGRFLKRTD